MEPETVKPPKPGYLYAFENKVNGKLYIGATVNLNKRKSKHLTIVRGGKEKYPRNFQAIHAAIVKYGEANFDFFNFQCFDTIKEALLAEVYWIAYLREQGVELYNISSGGDGCLNPSKETKLKMRLAKLFTGKIRSEDVPLIRGMSEAGLTHVVIGRKYDIDSTAISRIVSGELYTHVVGVVPYTLLPGEVKRVRKLTEEQVKDIRYLYRFRRDSSLSSREIGIAFGLKRPTVVSICRFDAYKYFAEDLDYVPPFITQKDMDQEAIATMFRTMIASGIRF